MYNLSTKYGARSLEQYEELFEEITIEDAMKEFSEAHERLLKLWESKDFNLFIHNIEEAEDNARDLANYLALLYCKEHGYTTN